MSILLQYPAIKELIADEIVKGFNEDRWDRFIQLSRQPERRYRAKMREVFSQQLDEIMQRLAAFKSKALEDSLVDFDKYRIQYVEFEQLMLPGILSGWADLELEALEAGISFNVFDPNVQIAISNRTNHFSDSVINETRDLLHRVINESAQAGEGIPQLEKRIRALYDSMTKYRAVRIARTETIWAQNEGAEQSYLQSGVIEEKEWWTARDERRCFAKNTLVETSEGEKFIQNIKVGDMVKTHLGFKRVTKVMVNKRRGKMLKMKFESGTHLICTPDHPIYEASKGWQYAEELNVGDELQTSQNEIIKITDIGYIKFFKAYDNIAKFFKTIIPFVNWCQLYNVYNIEVEDSHTYYAEGILVHNCDWCAEMHGKRMAVGADYFGLGSSMTLADGRSRTFNYENVSHPPLHPHCRCCLLPVVELTRSYMGYLAYKWLML